ncbi:hypothetical protein ES703_35271 [subsurface metagenome]
MKAIASDSWCPGMFFSLGKEREEKAARPENATTGLEKNVSKRGVQWEPKRRERPFFCRLNFMSCLIKLIKTGIPELFPSATFQGPNNRSDNTGKYQPFNKNINPTYIIF